jgi:CubicO group peptidase (beta-lactamase class C family)
MMHMAGCAGISRSTRRRTFVYRFPFLFVVPPSFAQGDDRPGTAKVGATDLARKSAEVDRLLATWDSPSGAGAAVVVTDNNRVVHRKGYGLADREKRRPFLADTPSLIGSVAKQFVAMPIMMLAEKGHLSYDDPLSKFFPNAGPNGESIKLRHLLNHTSGLTQFEEYRDRRKRSIPQIQERLVTDYVRNTSPRFAPGDKFEYCYGGYVVLASVAAKVTNTGFRELMHEWVFKPLQLNGTFFAEEHSRLNCVERAIGYYKERFGLKVSETLEALSLYGGAASIFSTTDDIQRWDQALHSEKLAKATTLSEAFRGGRLNDGSHLAYGFGWENMRYKGVRYMIHPGGWAGFKSFILRFPDQGFSAIALSNHSEFDLTNLPLAIARVYLANRIEVPTKIFNMQ